jgi:hypothetical protein
MAAARLAAERSCSVRSGSLARSSALSACWASLTDSVRPAAIPKTGILVSPALVGGSMPFSRGFSGFMLATLMNRRRNSKK